MYVLSSSIQPYMSHPRGLIKMKGTTAELPPQRDRFRHLLTEAQYVFYRNPFISYKGIIPQQN